MKEKQICELNLRCDSRVTEDSILCVILSASDSQLHTTEDRDVISVFLS
jgi:hypothetical protein